MFVPEALANIVSRADAAEPGGRRRCEALLQFLDAADAVRDHLRRALADEGSTELGFEVLTALLVAEGGPLPPSVIAERCGILRGTLTDVLCRLEAAGLVARQRNAADRRQLLAELTPRGRVQSVHLIAHYVRAMLEVARTLRPGPALAWSDAVAALKRPPRSSFHES